MSGLTTTMATALGLYLLLALFMFGCQRSFLYFPDKSDPDIGDDYAEWLPKLNPEDQFQFAQIVGVHGGKVSLKTEGAEQIMAISRAPVVIGNVPQKDEEHNYTTVGFMGQLPVVVRGKVKAGDYIIPSGREDGTAVAVSPGNLELRHLGRTLGRAWADSENDIYSLVNVAIGLNGNEEKIILEKQRDRIETQDRRQTALAADKVQLRSELSAMQVEMRNVLASRCLHLRNRHRLYRSCH